MNDYQNVGDMLLWDIIMDDDLSQSINHYSDYGEIKDYEEGEEDENEEY